jgi:hypothetical protein
MNAINTSLDSTAHGEQPYLAMKYFNSDSAEEINTSIMNFRQEVFS